MSISKVVIMGKVVRKPEKRFTSNDIAITTFAIDISNNDEPSLIRVITKGKLAESTADKVDKDQVVIIEGRLINNVIKNNSGVEKKVVEIDAQSVEVVNQAVASTTSAKSQSDISDELDYNEEITSDDLVGEDEIPF